MLVQLECKLVRIGMKLRFWNALYIDEYMYRGGRGRSGRGWGKVCVGGVGGGGGLGFGGVWGANVFLSMNEYV